MKVQFKAEAVTLGRKRVGDFIMLFPGLSVLSYALCLSNYIVLIFSPKLFQRKAVGENLLCCF